MKNSEHSRHVVGVFVVIDTAKLQVQESDTRWQERRIHYARAYMEAHELVSISCFCIAWCLGLAQTEWLQNQASAPEPIAAPAAVAAGVSEEFGGDALGDEWDSVAEPERQRELWRAADEKEGSDQG